MAQRQPAVIGVDIGGTNIKTALVDPQSKHLLASGQLKTRAERSPEATLAELGRSLAELGNQAAVRGFDVKGVGIGCAGIVNSQEGVVLTSPNLPGWKDLPLGALMGRHLGLPVFMENDVNCMGYGEYWLGAGRQLQAFLVMALGTGVGGCLLIDGKAWSGVGRSAGEVGHMTILPDGDQCRCGNRGCLETLASASWLVQRAEQYLRQGRSSNLEAIKTLEAEAIYRVAIGGDVLAMELFALVGSSLAVAIANVVHLLGIQEIVIGGGLANAWEAFIPSLHEELERRLTLMPVSLVRILRGQLGTDAGSLGAAYLAATRMSLI